MLPLDLERLSPLKENWQPFWGRQLDHACYPRFSSLF
jgi:hypothetical protein